jgi:Zn-finger nucleic acid-binding protein
VNGLDRSGLYDSFIEKSSRLCAHGPSGTERALKNTRSRADLHPDHPVLRSEPGEIMKLVSCPRCHAQYDVAGAGIATIPCRCGETFRAEPPAPRDSAVARCAACGALVGEAERACSYCRAEVTRRPEPSGPVCPECYARNPERAKYCIACGVEFLPQPVREREGDLQCPVCPETALAPRSLGGLWIEECPSCQGLWAPGDVMDRLVERVRDQLEKNGPPASFRAHATRHAAWQGEVQYRRCPECGGAMQRKNFGRRSGVIVDWCGSHGTWLDPHEMEDIAAFVLEGGLERRAPETGARDWRLPADPERVAAIAAAEEILARERARSEASDPRRLVARIESARGIVDLLALFLKR